jgi:hypothetical protein
MHGSLGDLLAYSMALVLASGAASKLYDRWDFARAIEAYEILPERLVPVFAMTWPLLELAAGVLLLPGATRGLGIVLALLVLLAASAAVVVNLARGRRMLDCGCGGLSGRQPVSWWLVVRNGVLAALLLALPALRAVAVDATGVVFGAGMFVVIYATVDQLLANGLHQANLRKPA